MSHAVPSIRLDLDLIPMEHQGQELILIRDPLGLVPEGSAFPRHMARVLRLLDGSRDLAQLQEELTRMNGGSVVTREFIETLLGELDQTFILASDRYQGARRQKVAEFEALPVREPALAGSGYPDEVEAIEKGIDDMLAAVKAPQQPEKRITALVAPHIDLMIGAKAYGRVYSLLKGLMPERVVILGVGHQLAEAMYSPSGKDFRTPLGLVKGEPELAAALRKAGGAVVAPDEFAHRSEHSIEFQLLFLQHLLPKDSFRVLPILCGPAAQSLEEYTRASFTERAQGFLDALAGIVAEPEVRTLVVAGVDLCHVGPKFGDAETASQLEEPATIHDKVLMDRLCDFDAKGFWSESISVADAFHVCGFTALATLLEVLPASQGKVLEHQFWHEEATRSGVGFASAALLKS